VTIVGISDTRELRYIRNMQVCLLQHVKSYDLMNLHSTPVHTHAHTNALHEEELHLCTHAHTQNTLHEEALTIFEALQAIIGAVCGAATALPCALLSARLIRSLRRGKEEEDDIDDNEVWCHV